ncbi:SprT-like domain-containing protein [Streptomyces sp. NBC_00249]|uniref:hypothetical protein n=1 Tax=Streptomyces sp. NBC_00249 TaxID=2975690 RepID=UPI002252C7E2|nr:hypothetical protein [Streptomyces sp. NBC_00249]MCX5199710.1 SprT-like domain-containing protein [Streptomyces sp. NBC_00249]
MNTTTATIPTQAGPAEAQQEHGSRIITALEGAWSAIRAQHPDVPAVLMITGTGRTGASLKWGHFGERRWTTGGTRTHELFAGGELISLGGRRTMQTLLHEAAHALAHVRGIKDTSSDYRYHNKRFVKIAEELGLQGPASPASVIGWSDCQITDAAAARYESVIQTLDTASLPYVHDPWVTALFGGTAKPTGGEDENGDDGDGDGEAQGGQGEGDDEPKKAKRPPTRFLVVCGCTKPGKDGEPEAARRIQISRATWEFGREDGDEDGGALMCGRCGEPFRKADEG